MTVALEEIRIVKCRGSVEEVECQLLPNRRSSLFLAEL